MTEINNSRSQDHPQLNQQIGKQINKNATIVKIAHQQKFNEQKNQRQAYFEWMRIKNNLQGDQSDIICTKYQYCLEDKINRVQQKEQFAFQIPEQLKIDDEIFEFTLIPESKGRQFDNNFIEGVDQYIQYKLTQDRRQSRQKKINEQKAKKERLEKLEQVQKQAKSIINNQSLRRKSKQPQGSSIQPKWGHSIYGEEDHKGQNHANNRQKVIQQQKQILNKSKSKDKIQLASVGQRINDYKQKIKQTELRKQEQDACKHKHINNSKSLSQIQSEIQKNAHNLLMNKKKQKLAEEQKRIIIQGKIRAIQLQSKQSLKKFKKKAVDPNIEFIVDVPNYTENKKQKKDKYKRQLPTQQAVAKKKQQKQNINSNLTKMKKTYSEGIRSKSRKSIKANSDMGQSNKQVQVFPQNQDVSESDMKNNKFFIWNVPVYTEDLKKLEEDSRAYNISKRIDGGKSFRNEVQEYLQNKMHKKLQEDIQKQKKTKFEQLVEQKKRAYLQQYQWEHGEGKNIAQEIYWEQDKMHKHHPISNFTNF